MKTIAIDVDGVILDSQTSFCNVYNNKLMYYYKSIGRKDPKLLRENMKKLSDIKTYNFYKDWKIPEKEFWEIWDIIRENLIFVPIIDKTIPKYLRKINKKIVVDIVTSMKEGMENILESTLKKYKIYKGIHYRNIIIVGRICTNKTYLGYDYYLDDSPILAKNIRKKKNQKLFLFTQNWNKMITSNKNTIRVNNWKDFYKKIRAELNG